MPTIEEVLDSLDPPVKHELQIQGDHASLLLLDPSVPAMVQRCLTIHEVNNKDQLRIVLLYAINELRRKGSHVPLNAIPDWDG